jgi:hypothetical protein
MNSTDALVNKIAGYLRTPELQSLSIIRDRSFAITFLAGGEYNLNYRLSSITDDIELVFRINIGTQINRSDQIRYEYQSLQLLKSSGVTPFPYWVDDSRQFFEQGILIMQYLVGEPFDYARDRLSAALVLSRVHQVEVPPENNHLIREEAPLSLIYDECAGLLDVYFHSDLADPDIRDYLLTIKNWANENRRAERYYQQDAWHCIVNTEVNSGNFIVNRQNATTYLVDWEMPRWGDPSQDVAHFCSPLTTLWKTTFRMTPEQKQDFIQHYKSQIHNNHLRNTLAERIALRDPFVRLRGISWSAMGWVAYQTQFDGRRNPDTWKTLQRYMRLDFIRSLFDPILKQTLY